jgi:hypothetical protein
MDIDCDVSSKDCGGPLVTLCDGYRCSALWKRQHPSTHDAPHQHIDGPRQVSELIASTPGGVLVQTECLGVCEHGPVIGVAYRDAGGMRCRHPRLFSAADEPSLFRMLLRWIAETSAAREYIETPPALDAFLIHRHRRSQR